MKELRPNESPIQMNNTKIIYLFVNTKQYNNFIVSNYIESLLVTITLYDNLVTNYN